MLITVKCVSENDKDSIVDAYIFTSKTLSHIAESFSTSARTVCRVLQERGLLTPVPRIKQEASKAMKIIKDNNFTVDELDSALKLARFHTKQTEQHKQRPMLFMPVVQTKFKFETPIATSNH